MYLSIKSRRARQQYAREAAARTTILPPRLRLRGDPEGVVLGVSALGAKEDRIRIDRFIVEFQVQAQFVTVVKCEAHAVGGTERVEVQHQLVAAIDDVGSVAGFQMQWSDVVEGAFGTQNGVEVVLRAGAVGMQMEGFVA